VSLALGDITSRKSIGADDIRGVIADCYIRPFSGEYKVYIIEDGDTLTPQAQNALLKILEEPPSYVIFILCVTNPGLIVPTVLSRSRVITFAPKSDAEIAGYIARAYPDMAGDAAFIAPLCGGAVERADALCGGDILPLRGEVLGILEALLVGADEMKVFDGARFIEGQAKSGGVEIILDLLQSLISDILKLKYGVRVGLTNADCAPRLSAIAARCEASALSVAADRVETAQQMLRRHVSAKAAVLGMLIGIYEVNIKE
jgi:DNA polymerase-3 subunit delta'